MPTLVRSPRTEAPTPGMRVARRRATQATSTGEPPRVDSETASTFAVMSAGLRWRWSATAGWGVEGTDSGDCARLRIAGQLLG